jgi:hypothetical protein
MAAVAGLRGTGDFSTDERPKNFREMILWLEPNGDAPIFALTSKAKKRTVNDPEYAWWDEPIDLVRIQVNGAFSSSDPVIAVDSVDPTAAVLDSNWGLPNHLKPGDLLLVEKADQVAYDNEILLVTGVIGSTQISVQRGAAGTTAASIADNSFLLLMGSVYAEGTAAPDSVSRNPVKYSNLVQIFKDSYEITGTVEVTKTRTGNPWSNDKKRKMFDHARGIEWSMMFGRQSETIGSNGKPLRTMGGIRSQIPQTRTTVFAASSLNAATPGKGINAFLDAVYRVFDYSSGAGDTRIAFMGNVALNTINKMVQQDTAATIEWGGPVKVYGMNLRELVFPQGRLLVRTHPLLNRHSSIAAGVYTAGPYAASAWILDFSAIEYVTLPGRDTKSKDDVQDKDEDLRRGFLQTDCSIQVDKGGLTCAYLGGLNNSAIT